MYRETFVRVERFERCVAENRSLEEALDFSRFLHWSGLLTFFEINAQCPPLTVDGPHLRWRVEELQRSIQSRYRLNDSQPHLSSGSVDSLHDKMDAIAGYLSKLASSPILNGSPLPDFESSELETLGRARAQRVHGLCLIKG